MKPKAKGTVGFLLILLLIFPLHVYAGGKHSDVESQDQEDPTLTKDQPTLNQSNTVLYIWRDENGVTTFSNVPTWALGDTPVQVESVRLPTQRASEKGLSETTPGSSSERPMRLVTQGEFAVQLVRELGLGENFTPQEAADILSSVRIAPRLGNWELNEIMTPELTTRLRTLTVSAAQMGWLTVTPEQALLAFDTAAALLGVDIPILTGKPAPAAPLPSVQVPPLIYLSPPPAPFYSSYTWVPIAGGFFWHGVSIHGFFTLHGLHLHGHFFNDHHFVFAPHIIQHHFVGHFVGHSIIEHHPQQHFVNIHTTGGRHFATTSLSAPPLMPHQTTSPRALHSRQLHEPGTPFGGHSLSPGTTTPRHATGPRAHISPPRPARPTARLAPRIRSAPHVDAPVHPLSRGRVSSGSHSLRSLGHQRTHGGLHSGSFGHGGRSGHSGGHSGGH
ncbi:DUF4124 domain-containing protein [Acidobacteria bacterium AH-259-D05]|nr:DUF4124 domain-containing protein [Acidobacteria bacterium AH-259-D05]